jgi:hypothetical protein
MRELDRPIGQVWRRLRIRRFLTALVWCTAMTLALAAVAIAVGKFTRPLPGPAWLPLAVALGLGVVGALTVALFGGPSRVDAAIAIDREFELNERLGTALTLPVDLQETPAGRALIADTVRHVEGLSIPEKFGIRLPGRSWVPLLPALVALGLLYAPQWPITRTAKAQVTAQKLDAKVVEAQTKALAKRIATQRKAMNKDDFSEAQKILAEIEKAADQIAKAPAAKKDQALVELNKLTDTVKDRQKQLGSPEQVNRQLQQLKEMSSEGPADDFKKALANADFQKAAVEIKKLQKKMASGKMNEAEKKALKEQVGEMKQQLQKLASMDQRKKQLEEAVKNGGLTKEQFNKEMAKLEDQAKNLEGLKKLAETLAKAEEQMANGDMKKAAEQLGMTEKQLTDMAKNMQELESLDGALADLQDAKNGMTGSDGANQLGESVGNMMNGRQGQGKGQGRGKGQGEGDRDEAKDDTASYTTKVKIDPTKGKAVFEGYAPPSRQMKGESQIQVQGDLETATGLAAEALSNQKVPKRVQKQVRGYFDRLNKGQ